MKFCCLEPVRGVFQMEYLGSLLKVAQSSKAGKGGGLDVIYRCQSYLPNYVRQAIAASPQ